MLNIKFWNRKVDRAGQSKSTLFLAVQRKDLSPELLSDVKKAAKAYVYGDQVKVAECEPLINMLFFPMQVARIRRARFTL